MSEDKTILDKLLEDVEEDNTDLQVKELCDKIQEEEDERQSSEISEFRPDHQNIFLVLNIKPLINNQYNFLALEREMPGKYIIGLWAKNKDNDKPVMRINAWDIQEVKPKKIILEFVKVLKIYN